MAYRYTYKNVEPGIWMSKRQFNREFLEPSLIVVGTKFKRDHMKKRFTRAGATELGFPKRQGERGNMTGERGGRTVNLKFSATYSGRKLKEKGHTRPNVWSGDSEQAAKIASIRATSKSVAISFPGLRDWNRRKPKGWAQTLSDQLRASGTNAAKITKAEQLDLERTQARYIDARVRTYRRTKTFRVT